MVFETVTRASYGARLKWFQALGWWRVSRMLRGLRPRAQEDRSALKGRPGFDDIGNKDVFGDQYGHMPAEPGDESHVWGVNSFAVSPMFEGALQPAVARQCGYRMPSPSYHEQGANSGVWPAMADPDATATVPGVVPDAKVAPE